MAAYDTKGYRGLLAAIRDWYMENEGIASYEDAIEAIMDRYAGTDEEFTRADAEEEFFSEAMAGLFSTDAGAKQFLDWLNDESKADTNEKKSIIKKMADLLQDLFDHIKALIRGGTLSKTAEDFALMEADRAQMLRQEFLAALDAMKENAQKGTVAESGAKFSIKKTKSMSWEEQIGAYYNRTGTIKTNDTLTLGDTPQEIVDLGVNNKPLAVPLSVISKAQSGKDVSHSLSNREIRTLDKKIQNPLLIVDNVDRNSLVFITKAEKGDVPVLISFEKDATFDGDEVHKATSVHFQMNTANLLNAITPASTVIVKNKTELERVPGTPVRLGRLNTTAKLIDNSVSQSAENVNPDNVQISEKDARTDAEIDEKSRHSLGITAASEAETLHFQNQA
ncbi:MAG: hypothetical protein IJL52_05895 [Clostridia bacterium]|nr:hypothetical protein [Clostridia bacterium]